MRDTLRVVIGAEEQHLPRDMIGFHAATELGRRLGINPSGLTLRRVADESYLGESVPIADVLTDGEELEFAVRPGLPAVA